MKIKTFKVSDLFNLNKKTNSSKFTKGFIQKHKGSIPVYSASKSPDSVDYGYVEDNLKGVKYFENCLTWNIDGSIGKAFYREGRFSLSEKVIPLILKEDYLGKLDYKFLGFMIEKEGDKMGFSFSNKAGKSKIKDIEIDIPIKQNGDFDLGEQKRLANKYEKIEQFKEGIKNLYQQIMDLRLSLKEDYPKKNVNIINIFNIKKGSSKYTRGYIRNNLGDYPVYSSQTVEEGIIGKINSYDYDAECLTWTTDGIHAGTVFYRKGKFNMTTHCGALIPKEELMEDISLEYVFFLLKMNLKSYATGEGNKRITVERMKDVKLAIPIKQGKYDRSKQNELAKKYRTIEIIKSGLEKDFKELMEAKLKLVA